MASLFLSYSRDDISRVAPLAAALDRDGHTVWWDRQISGGQEFADAIEQALKSADVVIVCWTSRSVRSAWVRDEAGEGRDGGRLVPVTLDGCQPPLGFRQYQTVDLSSWSGRPGSHGPGDLRMPTCGKRVPAEARCRRVCGTWPALHFACPPAGHWTGGMRWFPWRALHLLRAWWDDPRS